MLTDTDTAAAHSEHDFSMETVMTKQSLPSKPKTPLRPPTTTGTNGNQPAVQPAIGSTPTTDGPEDGARPDGKPPLPHERDQSAHMTDGIPSRKVQQAAKDVARGLQDTSKSPEMDRAYQKQKGR